MSTPAREHATTLSAASRSGARAGQLVGLGAACLMAAYLLPETTAGTAVFFAGSGLLSLAGLLHFFERRRNRAEEAMFNAVSNFVEHDAAASFTTNPEGIIGYQNAASIDLFGEKAGATLVAVLGGVIASPAAVLFRLQKRADTNGAAREDVTTRRGHLRLSAHRIGSGALLWRMEDVADRSQPGRGADSISLPMLTVSKSGTVLFMNDALRRLVGGRRKSLDRIFTNLPVRGGQVQRIHTPKGTIEVGIVEMKVAAERRELYLIPREEVGAAASEPVGLHTLPVALVRMSETGEVLFSNQAAQALLHMEPGEAVPFTSLVDSLGRPVDQWISEAAQGRVARGTEFLRARRAPQEVFLQVALNPWGGGGAGEVLAVLSDATELKSLEAQFVQSQKMQAIGQLAGGVAHDFNNLLTAITGHCDLLLLRHDPGDPDHDDLEQIGQNANRAAALVGQLLAFSRKQTFQTRQIDLRDTMADLTHLLNRLVGEKITLELNAESGLKHVRADPRQLEQVMMNLVVNARDAMPDGGTITIEARPAVLHHELIRDRATIPPGDYVVLQVSDAGIGIAPENLHKVFEPFYTTKRTGEGTGLGLSTVYGIVKQTGGFIFANSAVGSGTTFTLYFPAEEAQPETLLAAPPIEEAPAVAEPLAEGDVVILLVEDEAPVRAFASRALRMRGYTVLEAENAEDALAQLDDDSLHVDVFVTDVIMPGMDGPSWVSAALKRRPDTRVIFVSGYAQENFAESQAQIPHSIFLPKPFSLTELTDTVKRQLH
ncbi:MAG: ATP-binding protein [Pseudomonadota bacterium]